MTQPDPKEALTALGSVLAAAESPISEHVAESDQEPVFGLLAAAGPRAAADPAGYAFVVEAVREGYLLHYGTPRLLRGCDADLALLAGDYLYALGIERLAAIGDAAAVALLSDLIGGCAQLHAEGREEEVEALWRTSALAIGGEDDADRAAARVNRLRSS
jgi:hypothetical protein